jgi:hypothetical protein
MAAALTSCTFGGVGCRWTDVHVVFPKLWEADATVPAATLRNVASQLVLTKWTFVLDVATRPSASASAFAAALTHAEATYLPALRHDSAQVGRWLQPVRSRE